jgi:hypothetical protein
MVIEERSGYSTPATSSTVVKHTCTLSRNLLITQWVVPQWWYVIVGPSLKSIGIVAIVSGVSLYKPPVCLVTKGAILDSRGLSTSTLRTDVFALVCVSDVAVTYTMSSCPLDHETSRHGL